MASAEPILLSGVWLEFKKEPVHVHDIVREIIQVSKESRGKKVRIAFFYQNDSFDGVIPYGLEMLYQLKALYPRTATAPQSKEARNLARPEPRDKILVYGGKIYQYLKASYKDSYFGTGNFCNDLFGLGVVSQNGLIKGEKKIYTYGHRSKKKARDKFLFSSRYTLFPSSEVATSIAAVVIMAPALTALHRVAQICAWCDAYDIGTVALFDPFPTIRKLRFYESQNFIVYGWSFEDMKEAALNCHFTQQTPLSDSKRLSDLSNLLAPEILSVNDFDVCPLLDSAHSLLSDIRQKTDRDAFSRGPFLRPVQKRGGKSTCYALKALQTQLPRIDGYA